MNCLGTPEGANATAWPVMASAMAGKGRVIGQSAAKRPGNRSKVQRLGQVAFSARMAKGPRAHRPLRGVRYSLGCAETRRTRVQMTCERTNRPYTGLLDNLSKHPVQEIINKVLKNDAKKGIDAQAWYQFYSTPLKLSAGPAAGTATLGTDTSIVVLATTGTQTVVNSVNLHKNHIKSIVDIMKERNTPPFAGDEYMAIAWPTTWRPVKNDLEGVYQYRDEGFQMIYNGEIGKYEGVRFIEQTNIAKGNYGSGPFQSASSFTAWSNGLSDNAFFFGKSLPHAQVTVH